MAACLKYCVYLKDIAADSLTPEESEFMKTMEEIDIWYEAQMNQAKLEGEQLKKQESAFNLLRENVSMEIVSRTTGLTISELEGFANERLQQIQSSTENDPSD